MGLLLFSIKANGSNLGDVITRDSGYMRGHGTYSADDILYASVAGVVERVNKLISVTPLKTRLVDCCCSHVYIVTYGIGASR